MPRFQVIHHYEYTRSRLVDAKDADEAAEIANGVNDGDQVIWTESDCHNLTDETVQEEE